MLSKLAVDNEIEKIETEMNKPKPDIIGIIKNPVSLQYFQKNEKRFFILEFIHLLMLHSQGNEHVDDVLANKILHILLLNNIPAMRYMSKLSGKIIGITIQLLADGHDPRNFFRILAHQIKEFDDEFIDPVAFKDLFHMALGHIDDLMTFEFLSDIVRSENVKRSGLLEKINIKEAVERQLFSGNPYIFKFMKILLENTLKNSEIWELMANQDIIVTILGQGIEAELPMIKEDAFWLIVRIDELYSDTPKTPLSDRKKHEQIVFSIGSFQELLFVQLTNTKDFLRWMPLAVDIFLIAQDVMECEENLLIVKLLEHYLNITLMYPCTSILHMTLIRIFNQLYNNRIYKIDWNPMMIQLIDVFRANNKDATYWGVLIDICTKLNQFYIEQKLTFPPDWQRIVTIRCVKFSRAVRLPYGGFTPDLEEYGRKIERHYIVDTTESEILDLIQKVDEDEILHERESFDLIADEEYEEESSDDKIFSD